MTLNPPRTMVRPTEARYLAATNRLYSGNPLIDALPPIRSDKDWIQQLLMAPTFNDSDRDLDAEVRSYLVVKLKHLFIPTSQHIKLARRLDQLIRWGYAGRNPRSPERAAALQESYARAQASGKPEKARYDDVNPISTFSLIGCSGVGKSTTTEAILSSFPQAIHHPDGHWVQVVWLKVECPKDGSVRELALSILRAFDRVLGTQHAPKHHSRLTASTLTEQVNHFALAHHLGLLVLDEMQNLSVKKSGGREDMLNWFQELVNDLKVPVALLGTNKARKVLQLDLRHARRVTVTGSENWDRLKPGPDFDMLLEKIWRYQWLREPGDLTAELRKTIYDETQGIRAFMVDMFLVAQLHALWKRVETITPQLFKTVARTEFSAVQPMLNALRSGDPLRLSKFDDLIAYDVDEQIERARNLIPASNDLPIEREHGSLLGEACANVGSFLGLSPADARALVLEAMTEKHKTAAAITRAAVQLALDRERQGPDASPPSDEAA